LFSIIPKRKGYLEIRIKVALLVWNTNQIKIYDLLSG